MDPKIRELIIAQIEKSREKLDAAKSLLKEGFIDDASFQGLLFDVPCGKCPFTL